MKLEEYQEIVEMIQLNDSRDALSNVSRLYPQLVFISYLFLVTSGSSAASSWQLAWLSQSVLHLIQSPPSRLLLNPGTHG